jgi:hypothetical protein
MKFLKQLDLLLFYMGVAERYRNGSGGQLW